MELGFHKVKIGVENLILQQKTGYKYLASPLRRSISLKRKRKDNYLIKLPCLQDPERADILNFLNMSLLITPQKVKMELSLKATVISSILLFSKFSHVKLILIPITSNDAHTIMIKRKTKEDIWEPINQRCVISCKKEKNAKMEITVKRLTIV